MDYFSIGSLNSYTRMAKMQTQWGQRQSGRTVYESTGRSVKDGTNDTTFWKDYLKNSKESSNMLGLVMKLATGEKLSPAERKYLREKDPELYKKLVEMEREQKQYEERLKRCRTREEAAAVRVTRLGTTMEKLQANRDDLKIVIECKIQAEMDLRTWDEFTKTNEYKEMPENEGERERVEAEEAENEPAEMAEEASEKREAEETKPADGDEDSVAQADDGREDRGEDRIKNRSRYRVKAGQARPKQNSEAGKARKKRRPASSSTDITRLLANLNASQTAIEAYTAVLGAEDRSAEKARNWGKA